MGLVGTNIAWGLNIIKTLITFSLPLQGAVKWRPQSDLIQLAVNAPVCVFFYTWAYRYILALRSDGVPFAGDSLERSYLFYDRPSRLSSNAPACRGQSRLSGFCCAHRLCVRSPCQHISRMRTFDNNSCAISITSPRSLFRPRTQHGRWGHREKSRRASTRWDCQGKSCLAGLSPLSGTPSERRDRVHTCN